MSDLDLVGLRKTAEAATPGPWVAHIEQYGSEVGDYYGGHIPGVAEPVATEWQGDLPPLDVEDAQHIAAFDPPTVLAMLDRIEEQDKELAALRAWEAAGPYEYGVYSYDTRRVMWGFDDPEDATVFGLGKNERLVRRRVGLKEEVKSDE